MPARWEGGGGGAVGAEMGLDLGGLRAGALAVVVVLACVATLTQPWSASTIAPSGRPPLMRHVPDYSATLMQAGLAPAVSASVGASERRFWPVSRGSLLVAQGGGIRDIFRPRRSAWRCPGGRLACPWSAWVVGGISNR